MAKATRLLASAALVLACGCSSDPPTSDSRARTKPSEAAKPARDAELEPPGAVARPEPPPAPTFAVVPSAATLRPGDPGVQLRVEGKVPGGSVRWEVETPGIIEVGPDGYARAVGAGKATVAAVAGDRRVEAEVEVAPVPESGRPWDFAADVAPIFTRFGCNTGGCHGKADGQNGFHLSLFGYDPKGDHLALTREAGGRRVDPMAAERSLLIRKATGRTPHKGGLRLPPGSDAYRTLVAWVADGAPETRGAGHGALAEVRVEPARARLDGPGTRQLRVVARFADGHERDVTRLATYRSNDDRVAEVGEDGRVVLNERGEADVVVRYGSEVLAARVSAPLNPGLSFDFKALPRRNVIDEELFERLEALNVPPSPPADDPTFLRRVSLDLTGQLPLPDEVRAFVASKDPEKRAKKVDELMARPEFLAFWMIKFGDMLGISRARFGNGAGAYEQWLKDRLKSNAPWDRMARELLTALGNPYDFREGGPVNYALDGMGDPKLQAELTAQRFLGLRLRCAQCHNHPFDVWTQDDYFGLAAVFARVESGGAPAGPGMMMGRPEVRINPKGSIDHLRTKKPAAPRLLDGTPVEPASADDPRRTLVEWMTAPENPYFARAMANRVWAQFFGKGIADPPDDLSAANPPVHPGLLDALARHFVEHRYDLRDLIRTVATSEAYGLASTAVPGNERDARLFSHQMPRPLTAHQMADAVAQATSVPNRFGNTSLQDRRKAVEVFDPAIESAILDTFGRCPRDGPCSPVATPQLSLKQALLLIGGDAVDGKVGHLNGYLSNLLALDPPPSPGEIVEFLYYRTLCRPPSAEERSFWVGELEGAGKPAEAAEDLFWALLNSQEFSFNH
jgi:hypothetical protein